MDQMTELKEFLRSVSNKNPYEMFSIGEAAAAFNISRRRLTEALNRKELPEYRLDDKQRMLRRRDIEKWIDQKQYVEPELIRAKNFL